MEKMNRVRIIGKLHSKINETGTLMKCRSELYYLVDPLLGNKNVVKVLDIVLGLR